MKQWLFLLALAVRATLTFAATEPAANPGALAFSNIKAFSFTVSFTTVTADGYLVIKGTQPITFIPADGTVYEKGQGVTGGGKIVSANVNSILPLREVLEGTRYYMAVFAFNGSGSGINYRQANPAVDSVTAAASDPGNYYNNITTGAAAFIGDLHMLINPHNIYPYGNFKTSILPLIYERDTINGQAVINCDYSNTTTVYTPPFDFVALDYNREHSLPKSWMLTGGNTSNADGADYHNLLLTLATPNNARSNHPLGEVATVTQTYGEAKLGHDAGGNTVFEPRPGRKGDDARDMFYQMLCYTGSGGTWGLDYLLTEAPMQDQDVLKQWSLQDPPDAYERTRNEYIYTIQGNRNPFVDHPDWVQCINFDSLLKSVTCPTVSGVEEVQLNIGLKLFPNPVNTVLNVELTGQQQGIIDISILDITGRTLGLYEVEELTGTSQTTINTAGLQSGIYLLKVSSGQKSIYRKFQKGGE